MAWIDYRHIKASVDFNDVLAYYNIVLKQSATNHYHGPCPLPKHSGDRSNKNAFHVDTQKNAFNCFTHCGGGNIIDFVALMEQCQFRDAAVKITKLFPQAQATTDEQLEFKNRKEYFAELKKCLNEDQPKENQPLTFDLKGLKANHPFLLKEKKLTAATIKEFGLGFCSKGLLAGWLAIPVHNIRGQLVAYIGRSVNDTKAEVEGKYKIPPGYFKSLDVFNLFRVLKEPELIKKHGLIIVESFFSVFWLWQHGFKNVVSLMGWSLSDEQMALLLSASQRFAVFLDGDKTGLEAQPKILSKLVDQAFVRIINVPEGPQRKPTHFSKKELQNLLKTPQ